jgi:hypothetical protein
LVVAAAERCIGDRERSAGGGLAQAVAVPVIGPGDAVRIRSGEVRRLGLLQPSPKVFEKVQPPSVDTNIPSAVPTTTCFVLDGFTAKLETP